MARKKRVSFGKRLGHVVSDIADAASVAATGSQIGVLELAAEDEFGPAAVKRPRKRKTARKKAAPKKKTARKKMKAVSKKASKPKKKKRATKRR